MHGIKRRYRRALRYAIFKRTYLSPERPDDGHQRGLEFSAVLEISFDFDLEGVDSIRLLLAGLAGDFFYSFNNLRAGIGMWDGVLAGVKFPASGLRELPVISRCSLAWPLRRG